MHSLVCNSCQALCPKACSVPGPPEWVCRAGTSVAANLVQYCGSANKSSKIQNPDADTKPRCKTPHWGRSWPQNAQRHPALTWSHLCLSFQLHGIHVVLGTLGFQIELPQDLGPVSQHLWATNLVSCFSYRETEILQGTGWPNCEYTGNY